MVVLLRPKNPSQLLFFHLPGGSTCSSPRRSGSPMTSPGPCRPKRLCALTSTGAALDESRRCAAAVWLQLLHQRLPRWCQPQLGDSKRGQFVSANHAGMISRRGGKPPGCCAELCCAASGDADHCSIPHTSPRMACRPVRTEATGFNPHYNPRYNTSLCMHWQRGTCRHGNKCSSAHGEHSPTQALCLLQQNALESASCQDYPRAVLHWHTCTVRYICMFICTPPLDIRMAAPSA